MSLRERMAAYEASLKQCEAEAPPKVGPVADAPPVSLKRIQSAYALSAAAVNRERMTDVAPLQRAQSSSSFIEPPATEELLETILKRVADGKTSWVDLTFHNEFAKLSQKAKSDVIYRLADAGEAIETLKLNSVGLDNSNVPALTQLIRGNHKLHGLQLEGNLLTEPGLLELAAGVHGHRALSELSLASQKAALSTAAISRFIDAMEATPSLISCNLGHLRDDTARRRHQAANMANVDAMRQRRNAAREAGGPASPVAAAGPTQRRAVSFSQRRHTPGKPPPAAGVSTGLAEKQARVADAIANTIRDATVVADWEAEAKQIGASQMFEYGQPSAGSPYEKLERGTAYVATGSLLWSRASLEDQLAVIRAFGTNTTVRTVVMVNVVSTGAASDAVARAWADALQNNSTLTALNLESNGIQSDGIVALAEAVASPSCGLLELKLANQRLAVSQAAEETLAEAVATNRLLRTVTIDARSNRARELIVKTMNANIEEHRRAKRNAANPTAGDQAERAQAEVSEPRTVADLRSKEVDRNADAAGVNPDAAMVAQLSRAKPAAARRPAARGRRRAEAPAGEAGGQSGAPSGAIGGVPPAPQSVNGGGDEDDFSRSATWSPSTKKAPAAPKINIGAFAAEAGSKRLQARAARMPTVLASPEPSPRCSEIEPTRATSGSSVDEFTPAATWHAQPARSKAGSTESAVEAGSTEIKDSSTESKPGSTETIVKSRAGVSGSSVDEFSAAATWHAQPSRGYPQKAGSTVAASTEIKAASTETKAGSTETKAGSTETKAGSTETKAGSTETKAGSSETRPSAAAAGADKASAVPGRTAELGAATFPSRTPPASRPAPAPAPQPSRQQPEEELSKSRSAQSGPAQESSQPSWVKDRQQLRSTQLAGDAKPAPSCQQEEDSQPSWVKERQLRSHPHMPGAGGKASAQQAADAKPAPLCQQEEDSQPSWVKERQLRAAPPPAPQRSQTPPEQMGEDLPSWAKERQLRSVKTVPPPASMVQPAAPPPASTAQPVVPPPASTAQPAGPPTGPPRASTAQQQAPPPQPPPAKLEVPSSGLNSSKGQETPSAQSARASQAPPPPPKLDKIPSGPLQEQKLLAAEPAPASQAPLPPALSIKTPSQLAAGKAPHLTAPPTAPVRASGASKEQELLSAEPAPRSQAQPPPPKLDKAPSGPSKEQKVLSAEPARATQAKSPPTLPAGKPGQQEYPPKRVFPGSMPDNYQPSRDPKHPAAPGGAAGRQLRSAVPPSVSSAVPPPVSSAAPTPVSSAMLPPVSSAVPTPTTSAAPPPASSATPPAVSSAIHPPPAAPMAPPPKPSHAKEQRAPPNEAAPAPTTKHQRQPSQPSWLKPHLRSYSKSAVHTAAHTSDTDTAGFSSTSSEPSPVYSLTGVKGGTAAAGRTTTGETAHARDTAHATYSLAGVKGRPAAADRSTSGDVANARGAAHASYASPLKPKRAVPPIKTPSTPSFEPQPAGATSPIDDLVRFDAGFPQRADPFPSPRTAKPPPPATKPRMKLRSFSQIFASQDAN